MLLLSPLTLLVAATAADTSADTCAAWQPVLGLKLLLLCHAFLDVLPLLDPEPDSWASYSSASPRCCHCGLASTTASMVPTSCPIATMAARVGA